MEEDKGKAGGGDPGRTFHAESVWNTESTTDSRICGRLSSLVSFACVAPRLPPSCFRHFFLFVQL